MAKKLNRNDVIEIKRMLEEGDLTQKEIADQFEVHHTSVSDINLGKMWSDISADDEKTPKEVVELIMRNASDEEEEKIVRRFVARIEVEGGTGCWVWTGTKTSEGYGTFSRDGTMVVCHRYSYDIVYGLSDSDDMQVNHHCDNRACLNPTHLYEGTQKENITDAMERADSYGRKPDLTQEDIATIRVEAQKEDRTHSEIADEIGVSRSCISKIVNGYVPDSLEMES